MEAGASLNGGLVKSIVLARRVKGSRDLIIISTDAMCLVVLIMMHYLPGNKEQPNGIECQPGSALSQKGVAIESAIAAICNCLRSSGCDRQCDRQYCSTRFFSYSTQASHGDFQNKSSKKWALL
jgi:hypothetical protein